MLTGATNEEKIWYFFQSKGLNDYACAGILGNANAESGLKPNNLQDTYQRKLNMTDDEYTKAVDNGTYNNFIYDAAGYGIFQFTYWTLKKGLLEYAHATNRSIGNLEMQLEYSWKTFEKSYSSMLNTLKTATSVFEASNAVLLKFECPADQSVSMQNKRASYGQSYYNKYAKKGSNETMTVKTYQENSRIQLSKNFNSYEFRCGLGSPCSCSTILIDDKLVEYLQKIRDHFGKSITITSAYRCQSYNKSIGSGVGSYHTRGMACDFVVSGVAPREVAKYAESIGIKGIGLYETKDDGNFVHIDTRTAKAFWYGQAQEPRSTFGGTSNIINNNSSAVSISSNYIVLSCGSYGSEVKKLQENLNSLGCSCGIADGDYGEKTADAVRKFQKKNGLTVDGIAGSKTLAAIDKAINSSGTRIKITASLLNVRAGSGTNYKIVTTVKKDSIHKLLEEKNGWGRISSGWIKSDYYKKCN
jgi:uncharacterized protein YcbK (DUF882 family)